MTRQSYTTICTFALLLLPVCRSAAQPRELPSVRWEQDMRLQQPLPDSGYVMRLLNKGIILTETNPDSGVILCREALQLSRAGGYTLVYARALYALGVFHSVSEDYDLGLSYYMQALQYAGGDTFLYRTINSCIFNIGECYYRKGDYGLAVYYYYKLLNALRTRPGERKIRLNVYNRLAAVWVQFRLPEQAFYYADLQEQMALADRDSLTLAVALSTKGGLYLVREEHDKAYGYYARSLAIEKKLGIPSRLYNQQIINNNMALIHIQKGEPALAIPYAEEALRMSPVMNSLIGTIDARFMLGYAYAGLKQYEKAEGYLRSGLRDAEAKGMTGNTTSALLALADICRHTGRYREALQHMSDYVHISDSLRGEKNAHAAGILETKYRTSEKDRQLVQKQLQLVQQQNRIREKNLWLTGISAGILLLSVALITRYRSNRHKQRLQENQIRLLRQEQEILQQQQEIIQLNAMMKGEEKERTRIARELHDGIGGMLAAIKMNVNTVQEQQDDHEMRERRLDKIMRMVEETTAEVRKTAHNLMPDILIRHNLAEALQIYCQHIQSGGGLQIALRIYGSLAGLDKGAELILYRIIQELTQNIIKHAGAGEAVIELTQQDDKLHIVIEDNGSGFDIHETGSGFGLQNLRYRVQALQGELSIESAKGFGTTIGIEFDLLKLQKTLIA